MHYRNGREAKNGDEVVQLNDKGQITDVGVLIRAVPANDYCNGIMANETASWPTTGPSLSSARACATASTLMT